MATAYVRYKAPDGTISAWQIQVADNVFDTNPTCIYGPGSSQQGQPFVCVTVGHHSLTIPADLLVECQLVADQKV